MTLRGWKRSVTTPPASMRIERGMACSINTVPRAPLRPVRESTSQERATNLNWSPMSEMPWPSHRLRKLLMRSGVKSVGAAGSVAAGGPVAWRAASVTMASAR